MKTGQKKLIINILAILLVGNIFAQSKILRGQVVNENFEPLSNAIIRTSILKTFETDDLGFFEINIDNNTIEIEAIFIGYKTEKIDIENKCYVNIVMINYNTIEFETFDEEKKFHYKQRRKLNRKYKKAVKSGLLKEEENCR